MGEHARRRGAPWWRRHLSSGRHGRLPLARCGARTEEKGREIDRLAGWRLAAEAAAPPPRSCRRPPPPFFLRRSRSVRWRERKGRREWSRVWGGVGCSGFLFARSVSRAVGSLSTASDEWAVFWPRWEDEFSAQARVAAWARGRAAHAARLLGRTRGQAFGPSRLQAGRITAAAGRARMNSK